MQKPDSLDVTLAEIMEMIVNGEAPEPGLGIMHHAEGVDFMPANIGLAGVETALVNVMSRETVLRQYIDSLKDEYGYILVDTMPSFGMLTINALAAADTVLVPLQTQYLSLKGLEQLIVTILKVKKQINPRLDFEGILMTMVDTRTNYSKEIMGMAGSNYGKRIPVFQNCIPMSVRAAETSAVGKSIYLHDPKGRAVAGLDCSGFVGWAYWTAFGVKPGMGTGTFTDSLGLEQIGFGELQPGDIGLQAVPGAASNHIGIFLGLDGNGKALWVHCSGSGGVVVNNTNCFRLYYRLM